MIVVVIVLVKVVQVLGVVAIDFWSKERPNIFLDKAEDEADPEDQYKPIL